MSLNTVSALASADEERKRFLQRCMAQVGLNESESIRSVDLLVSFAGAVTLTWDGHIQRIIRDHSTRMASEIGKVLSGCGLDEATARSTAMLWLQNVGNAPILLDDDPHVLDFCKRMGLSSAELVDHADNIGLNVAVLDDLLALTVADTSEQDHS